MRFEELENIDREKCSVFASVFLIVAAVFLVMSGILSIRSTNKLFDSYGQTTAEVIEYDPFISRARNGTNWYHMTYRYTVKDTEYVTKYVSHVNRGEYEGAFVNIYYVKSDPGIVIQEKDNSKGRMLTMAGVVALVMAVGSFLERRLMFDDRNSMLCFYIFIGLLIFGGGCILWMVRPESAQLAAFCLVSSGIFAGMTIGYGVHYVNEHYTRIERDDDLDW